MKQFLLLSAVFGIGLTGLQSAAKAETWWLVLAAKEEVSKGGIGGIYSISTSSEQECEVAGAKIKASKEIHGEIFDHLRYVCVKGK